MFDSIQIEGWRQFREVEILFHPRLTVLTGANGAGKTTILNMLNRHFGWNLAFISTPRRKRDVVKYWSDYWQGTVPGQTEPEPGVLRIGTIRYRDQQEAEIQVPGEVQHEYQISLAGQQPVQGLFVSSHRPIYFYQRVTTIPAEPSPRAVLLNNYLTEIRSRYTTNYRVQSPSMRLKEALISLAVFGPGNDAVAPNPEYERTYSGFQEILRRVLPPKLGFERLLIEMPDVILQTRTGNFSLDAVSGGVSSILDLAWQIYMYSTEHAEFCVVIDEPENHLHPELQQTLLPSLVEAFPGAQFIIATHNPFMVSSVADSNVYVLRFDEGQKVVSELLDTANKAGTSNEILREVLGLDFTMPIWAEDLLADIVERHSGVPLSQDMVETLRGEMRELGLSDVFPETLSRIVREGDDDQAE